MSYPPNPPPVAAVSPGLTLSILSILHDGCCLKHFPTAISRLIGVESRAGSQQQSDFPYEAGRPVWQRYIEPNRFSPIGDKETKTLLVQRNVLLRPLRTFRPRDITGSYYLLIPAIITELLEGWINKVIIVFRFLLSPARYSDNSLPGSGDSKGAGVAAGNKAPKTRSDSTKWNFSWDPSNASSSGT